METGELFMPLRWCGMNRETYVESRKRDGSYICGGR